MLSLLRGLLLVAVFVGCALGKDTESDETEDFFEVDVKRIQSKSELEFGAQLHHDNSSRYERMIADFGGIFTSGYWQTVWEVSGAAPAPRDASDDEMERWVGSIYWNIAPELPAMEDTSRMLLDSNVLVVGGSTTAPNTYYATPNNIKRMKEEDQKRKDGIEIEEIEWTAERVAEMEANKNEGDEYYLFMTERSLDYAKFWGESMKKLASMKIHLPYIELAHEPDSKEFMVLMPDDYVTLLKLAREQMRARNISDDANYIVGPTTSSPEGAFTFIEALGHDREAYDLIHAWSFHLTDTGESIQNLADGILKFRQAIKGMIPSSWPKKPIYVTSFRYEPESARAFDDVSFNGDLRQCYLMLYGRMIKKDYLLPNSMSQSPKTGVRLLASLFVQYSYGVSKSIYDSLADQNWGYDCSGLYDRKSRKKQIFAAFSTFLPYVERGSVALKRQWKDTKDCFTVGLRSKNKLIFAVANTGESSCTRSFSLKGVKTEAITDGFVVTYNNGTVSLAANEPWEALITSQPLSYDVFPADDDASVNVVEFDVIVGPHASATAILDFTPKPKEEETAAEETKESVLTMEPPPHVEL